MHSEQVNASAGCDGPVLIGRRLCLITCLLITAALSAAEVGQEHRRIEAALALIGQEQQSLYQQFQMVQTLLRSEPVKPVPPPPVSYADPGLLNYEDVRREETARLARIAEYQRELERLYSRYRELDAQRTELLRTLSELAQQRE